MKHSTDQQLEEYLRKIQLKSGGANYLLRVEKAIESDLWRTRRLSLVGWLSWGAYGAAAAILLLLGWFLFYSPGNSPLHKEADAIVTSGEGSPKYQTEHAGQLQPVSAQNSLRREIDEGIVFLGNGFSARQMRYQFIDRMVWEDPVTGDLVEIEVPRDEVVLVPVQTL